MATVKKFNVRHGLSAGNGAIKDVISDTGLVYDVGTLSTLKTTAKSDTVTAINELFDDLVDITAITETNEPMGVVDRADSAISFDNATKTFSISVAAGKTQFVVWTVGVRRIYTTTQSVSIGASPATGLYYIYFNSAGVLSYKTTYFTWEADTPIAYVYWNATTAKAEFVADERHGIVLDWQTHEYLHRTRGAVIASGFSISAYTTTGDGSADAHAQFDLSNGTFFDEDLEVNITHSATPTTGTFTQILTGAAELPVFYISGSAGEWVRDTATEFACKQSATTLQYNSLSAGVWSTTPADNNRYVISWVVATNDIYAPIITILGQAEYTDIGSAEAALFGDLTLTNFPIFEFRPLWKVIFKTSIAYANTPNAYIARVLDIRELSNAGAGGSIVSDHGLLTGLADDDHNQYIHTALTRTGVTAEFNTTGKITTTNIIGAGAGSAAAPSITIVDDLDTGIYSPGADQLAISTAGTGRLFVDASGNVGVGSTASATSARLLDVNGVLLQPTLLLRASSATAASTSYSLDTTSNLVSFISSNWPVRYFINGSERLRITSDGKVGIGISTPNLALHVSSGTAAGINNVAILKGGGSSSGNGAGLVLSPDSNNTYSTWLGSRVATAFGGANWGCDLILSTNNNSAADNLTERMRITSTGEVGIGTSAPEFKLDINCNQGDGLQIYEISSGNNRRLRLTQESGGVTYNATYSTGSNAHIWQVGNTEMARIDSSGRLLVGTSSASTGNNTIYARVQVVGNSAVSPGGGIINIGRNEAATSITTGEGLGTLVFGDSGAGEYAWITCEADGNAGSGDYPGRLVFATTADGAAAPTERMVIKSDGKVGIGTGSPGSLLTSYAGNVSTLGAKASTGLLIENNGNVGNISQIGLGYTFTNTYHPVSIAAVTTSGAGSTRADLVFAVRDLTTDIAPTERLRITSAGLVGIGTSSVDALLQVEGTQTATWSTSDGGTYSIKPYPTEVAVINQQLATTNSFASIYFQGGKTTSNTGIRAARIAVLNDGTTYGSPIVFANRNASTGNMVEALRIDSSQRVGIGTASPAQLLHISGSGAAYARIDGGSTSTVGVVFNNGDGAIYYDNNTDYLRFDTLGGERVRITSEGKVGIGTSSPGYRLDVATTGISISASFTSDLSEQYIALKDSGTTLGHVRLGSTSNSMLFFAGNSERARIDSSGRLLVGVASARSNLYNSTGTPKVQVESTSSDGSSLSLTTNFSTAVTGAGPNLSLARSGATSLGSSAVVAANNTLGNIVFLGADGSEFVTAAQISAEVDGTPGANDMPGRLVFSTTADGASSPTERMVIKADGNVGIGTSSPAAKLHVETIPAAINSSGSVLFGPNTNYGLEIRNVIDEYGFPQVELRAPVAGNGPMLFFAGGATERMRIANTGNVGIGTSSPTTKLQVGAGNTAPDTSIAKFNTADVNAYALVLSNWTGVATSYGPKLAFDNSTHSTWVIGGEDGGGAFIFKDVTLGNNERMRIDSSGRLLVGTSTARLTSGAVSPLIQLEGTGNARIMSIISDDSNTGSGGVIQLGHQLSGTVGGNTIVTNNAQIGGISFLGNDGTGFIQGAVIRSEVDGTPGNADMPCRLVFGTTNDGAGSATERMVIKSDGKVGIGTSSPSLKLSVDGDVWFGNGSGVETGSLFNDAGVLHLRATSNVTGLALGAGGSEKVRLTYDGKVGIGTNSPLTRLDVGGGVIRAGSDNSTNGSEILRGYYSNGALAVIGTENSSGGIVIGYAVKPSTSASGQFLSSTGIGIGRGAYVIAGNEHRWYLGGAQVVAENSSVSTTEVMRLDSSGRLMVGTPTTSNTGVRFLLHGNSGDSTGGANIHLARGTATPVDGVPLGNIVFTDSNHTNAAVISGNRDGGTWTSGSSQPTRLVFSTTADGASTTTEQMRITSAGNVGIGTTTPGYRLEVNGSFAATTKSFVIPHPTKEGHKLRYGSLEGPENGVYVRGRSKDLVIDLPEYWTKLVDPDSITVNLTPIGKSQALWVKDIRDNRVYVGSKCSEVKYFYTVFAERADVDKLETEVEE